MRTIMKNNSWLEKPLKRGKKTTLKKQEADGSKDTDSTAPGDCRAMIHNVVWNTD